MQSQPQGSIQALPQVGSLVNQQIVGSLAQQNLEIACLNNKRRDSRGAQGIASQQQQQQPQSHQIITISNQTPAQSYQLYGQENGISPNMPSLNPNRQVFAAQVQPLQQLQQINSGQQGPFQIQQQPSQSITIQPQSQNHFLGPQNQYTQAVNISNINQNQGLDGLGLSGAVLSGVDSNRILQIHVSNQQPQHILYATGSQNPIPSAFPLQHSQTIAVPAHHLHQQYINGQVMNSGPLSNTHQQQNQSQTNLVNIVSQHQLMFVNSASQLGGMATFPNQTQLTLNHQPHLVNQMPTPPQIQYIEINQPSQSQQQQPGLPQPMAQFNITTGYGQTMQGQPLSYSQNIYQQQPMPTVSSQQQQQQQQYVASSQYHQAQQPQLQPTQISQQQYISPSQGYSFNPQGQMMQQQPASHLHQPQLMQQPQNQNFQRGSGQVLQAFNPNQLSASPHSQPAMPPQINNFQQQHLTLEQQQLLIQPPNYFAPQPISQHTQLMPQISQQPQLTQQQSQQPNLNHQQDSLTQHLQIRQQNSAGQRRPPNIMTHPLSDQPNSCSQGFDMQPNQVNPNQLFSAQDQQVAASKFYNPRQKYSQQRSNTINHQKGNKMNEYSSGNSNNRQINESNIMSEKALLEQHLNQMNEVPQGVLLNINNYQGPGMGPATAGFNSGGQGAINSGNNSSLNDVSLAGSFGNQAHYKPHSGNGIFQQVQSITNQMISSPPMKQASNIEKYLEEQKKVEGILELDDIEHKESAQKLQGMMQSANQPFSLNNSQQQEFISQIQRPLIQANPCPQELSGCFQNDKAGVSVSSVSQSEQIKFINGDPSQGRIKDELSSQLLTPKKLSHTVNHPGTKKRKSRAAQNAQQEPEISAQRIQQEEEKQHQHNSKSLPQQTLSNLNQQFQAMNLQHRSADNQMGFNQNLNISGGQGNSQNNGSSGQDQKGAVRSVSKECSNLDDFPVQSNAREIANAINAQISQNNPLQSINEIQAPLSVQLSQAQHQAQQQYQQEQRVWMLNEEISKTAHVREEQQQFAQSQNQEIAASQDQSQQAKKPLLPQVPSDEYEGIKYERTHNLNSKSFTCTQQFQGPSLNLQKDTKQKVYLVKNNLKNNLF